MENGKEVVTMEEQAEWEALSSQGSQYTGKPKNGIFIPTVKLNNSDKVKKETGVPLGHLYLTYKDNGVEKVEDLGLGVAGIILKTSYSIKSIFDPNGIVNFYSREFDDFFNDEITVLDGKSKEVKFQGSYKHWKESNQIISSRGSKNDFVLQVHLYILKDADFETKKVVRVTVAGKSMSNWFGYTTGDKETGLKSIYDLGIAPHTHVHEMTSLEETNPKNETYWSIGFSFGEKITLDQLREVVALQKELNDQLMAMRGVRRAEQPAMLSEAEAPQTPRLNGRETPENPDGIPTINLDEQDEEIRIEDVPF